MKSVVTWGIASRTSFLAKLAHRTGWSEMQGRNSVRDIDYMLLILRWKHERATLMVAKQAAVLASRYAMACNTHVFHSVCSGSCQELGATFQVVARKEHTGRPHVAWQYFVSEPVLIDHVS